MTELKIKKVNYVTHNVKRFIVEKPKDFPDYRPGQATHLSVNKKGWKDKKHPFTFTSLNNWDNLEFTIKIYKERKGVTHELGKLEAGDTLLLHDIFDTIKYKGPGVFIAAGTGITPFMAIFRALKESGNIKNVALLYSNKTQDDIIYGSELQEMLGNAFLNVFTRQGVIGFREKRIDRSFLMENIGKFDLNFYVCGPEDFTAQITDDLVSLGAEPESVSI